MRARRRPDRTLRRVLAACAPAALAACSSVGHSLDDLKSVHTPTSRTLEHRYEVERYGAWAAMAIWGPLSMIPGLAANQTRKLETLEAPASFCVENVAELEEVNLQDLSQMAAVLHWAGAIVEGDPFPLSKIRAISVVAKIAGRMGPDMNWLGAPESDYIAATDRRLKMLEKFALLSSETGLGDALRKEYVQIIHDLGSTPYPKASESRGIGSSMGTLLTVETDPEIRAGLEASTRVLVSRGSLQTLDRALADPEFELVRIAAAYGMVRAIGRGAVLYVCTQRKADPSAAVRRAVAALAGDYARANEPGWEPLIEYLVLATRDPEPTVAVNAMESLSKAVGQGRHLRADFWRAWWEERLLSKGASRPTTQP